MHGHSGSDGLSRRVADLGSALRRRRHSMLNHKLLHIRKNNQTVQNISKTMESKPELLNQFKATGDLNDGGTLGTI